MVNKYTGNVGLNQSTMLIIFYIIITWLLTSYKKNISISGDCVGHFRRLDIYHFRMRYTHCFWTPIKNLVLHQLFFFLYCIDNTSLIILSLYKTNYIEIQNVIYFLTTNLLVVKKNCKHIGMFCFYNWIVYMLHFFSNIKIPNNPCSCY